MPFLDPRLKTHKVVPLLEEVKYYIDYINRLEVFLYKESLTLTTLQYYKIVKETENIKAYINKLKKNGQTKSIRLPRRTQREWCY